MSIPHSKPLLGLREIFAVAKVIRGGHLSQGKEVELLERKISELSGHRYVSAVNSGTSALYFALKALGIKDGDTVVIPSYSCTALLNAVTMTGAQSILCDVDPVYGNADVDSIKKVIRVTTRAIIVPHLFGVPAPIQEIGKIGIPVIEDCAHCMGLPIENGVTGSMSVMAVFSFYTTKLIAAGEGGAVATSDSGLSDRIRDLREYDNRSVWEPRFNLKLTDLQAACANVQIDRLNSFYNRRKKLAEMYNCQLITKNISKPEISCKRVWFRYIIQTSKNLENILYQFHSRDIRCERPIFYPLHKYLNSEPMKNSEHLYNTCISLPLYPAMKNRDVELVADVANSFM